MSTVQDLISQLDRATQDDTEEIIVGRVKEALIEAASGGLALPGEFYQPVEGHYARRLVHRAPDGRYSVIAMVWGPGQSTPLHDHDHLWCVECVLEGKIKVTQYHHLGRAANGYDQFEPYDPIYAVIGEAGHLIPPSEYHVLENAVEGGNSITLHVYGGDMNKSTIFIPQDDGLYKREIKHMGLED